MPSTALVLDALASGGRRAAADVRRAAMLLGSTAAAARLAADAGVDGLAAVRLQRRPPGAADAGRQRGRRRGRADQARAGRQRRGRGRQARRHPGAGAQGGGRRAGGDPHARRHHRPACPRWSSAVRGCRPGRWCSTARRSRCARTGGRSRSRSRLRAPRREPTSRRCARSTPLTTVPVRPPAPGRRRPDGRAAGERPERLTGCDRRRRRPAGATAAHRRSRRGRADFFADRGRGAATRAWWSRRA